VSKETNNSDETRSFVALTSGTSVLHYKILEKIGSGGMGEVYLALDTKLNRKVALKFLPPHLCQDEDCRKRFTREAQAAAGLDHPNVAAIHEVGDFQGRPFYAMQIVEGQSLKDVIAGKDLSIDRILEIGIQVCEGLQAAHDKGIIHRDVKPSNILIDGHGRVRIVDFGLAAVRGSDNLTKTGSTLGTIGYMSPEQVQGKEVDLRSDLFSLGVVFYELITKQNPFRRDSEAATLKAVSDDTVEPLSRYKREVPDLLESIASKLLEKNPEHRYQSAAGIVSDLKRIKQDSGSSISVDSVDRKKVKLLRIVLPVLLVLLTIILLTLQPWRFEISPGQEAVASDNRLAIMYFENLGDPDDSLRIGEIVTNLLITDLTESKYTNVVSSQRLYDILRQLGHEGERRIGRDVATQVAETAKARWMLLGTILSTEPELVIASQIVEVANGDAISSQRIEGHPDERIFSVVDRLTSAVRDDLSLPAEAEQEEDPLISEMTTESPEAYRLYLEGKELFFKHHWSEAKTVLLKAINIDSTFALAHFYLGIVDYWRNDPQSRVHISNAMKYSDNVSHRLKLFINSYHARIHRDLPRSIELLKEIIEKYPDEKDAYISLGLLLKFEMNQVEETIPYFEKAVELDPFHREAYNQLAYAYNDLGRFDRAMWAVNKYIEIAPDEANGYDSRGEILAMNGQLDEAIASFEQAIEIAPGFSRSRLAALYLYRGDSAKADSLWRAMATDSNDRIRASGRLAFTGLPRFRGKFQEALSMLETGIATDRMELGTSPKIAEKLVIRILINDLLGDREMIVDDLKQAIAICEEHEARDLFIGFYRAYLVAEFRRNGEHVAADSLMAEITSTIMETGFADSMFFWLASGLTSFGMEQYDSAAVIWEKVASPAPYHFPGLMYLGVSYLRSGRLGDAVTTLEKANRNYDDTRYGTPDMGVLCYYYLGRAYEESGWANKAIDQYERFLEIWKDADQGIREVNDTKNRLANLKSGEQ